ncbi:MAG TPA: sulfatase-like hydrolase/transferase [Chloroflexota bacterium]|nr:sulfatase-like hydrolase/transferase [Chloroflexota bacterium]
MIARSLRRIGGWPVSVSVLIAVRIPTGRVNAPHQRTTARCAGRPDARLLEQTGQGEDTLVIFVSDHGESLGDHYPWGKRSFYDGAARIPFVLNWRGRLPAGAERDGPVGLRDLARHHLR